MNLIARYIIAKFRASAIEHGHEATARRLRKQGIPLEIALLILFYAR